MQTIIQNSFILQYYPYQNIDQKILELFDNSSADKTKVNFIKRSLNVYLNVSGQSLSFLDLSSEKFKRILDDFYFFLNSDYFNLSYETIRTARQQLIKTIQYIKKEIPSLSSYILDINKTKLDVNIDAKKFNYFNGWFLKSKDNKKSIFINLITFFKILGEDKTNLIHKNAQRYVARFEIETIKSFLSILNNFSDFLITKELLEVRKNINSEEYLFNLLKDFCLVFFKREESENRCLYNSKRKWNKFTTAFEEIFLDGIILPKLNNSLPKAPNSEKKGFEKRVKTSNGKQIKAKLITEIPLNISDDLAMDILFKKIKSDIDFTLFWISEKINNLNKNYNQDLVIKYLGKDMSTIQKEWETRERVDALRSYFITSYDLEPFMFLLISEHPQITESFLLNLELYDNSNNLTGYIKSDNNSYLVGYKKRRGSELAEQKILLNEKSKTAIENVIQLTKGYRNYLKGYNNDDWRYLFLHGGANGVEPQRYKKSFVPAPSNLNIKEGQERIKFFEESFNLKKDEATMFVSNMTMTKLRASIAVQLYLDNNDTQKMAEALGHKKYKPELLSYYLPESILDFFQSRWIRIFQKGIICEAMKDSENFKKASNFKSIQELEDFMKLYSLKNIPNNRVENSELNNKDEIFIGINEDILNVLLSLEKAVMLANQDVSSNALYWSKFANKLQSEILNNKSNIQFVKDLENAKNKLNPNMFKGLIYEN